MSQPDQQHKLLPQPGPWCREAPHRLGRAKRLRRASVLPPPPTWAGRPCPSPRPPETPPSAARLGRPGRAPRAPATAGGAGARRGPDGASPRNRPLWKQKARPGPGGGAPPLHCPEGSSSPGPLRSRKRAAKVNPDANGIRRSRRGSERRSRASPAARQALRADPAALPPRLRAALPAPLPARAHSGGWAAAGSPPAPRSPRPSPPRRLSTGEGPGRFPLRWTRVLAPR